MIRSPSQLVLLLWAASAVLLGCQSPAFREEPELLAMTDARQAPDRPAEAVVRQVSFQQPVGPSNSPSPTAVGPDRPIRLAEAVQIALSNTSVIRDRDDFLSRGNRLLNQPGGVASAFDVSLQQTSETSVEAALAEFDSQFAMGVQWGRNALIQGNRFRTYSANTSDLFATGDGSLFARYDKPLQQGGLLSVIPTWNYTLNNLPQQSFNAQYAGYVRAEYRQPLLAGNGRGFTEVAGPLRYRGGTGRGVALAEIDEHIAMLQFDAELQELVLQTEELYWDLWLAYQRMEAQAAARAGAEAIWQRVQRRAAAGLEGAGAADVAEAEEHFHQHRGRAAVAAAEVRDVEASLRRLIGISATDAGSLRPVDVPGQAPIVVQWDDAYARAVANRTELRQGELWLHSLELQLEAARSLALPQLDLVTGLQANQLDGGGGSGGVFDSDRLGWNAGLEFSIPFGLRKERLRIHNAELQIAKAQAALGAQQEEIAHEMGHAIRAMQRWHETFLTTTDRLQAAHRRMAAVNADYEAGRTQLDRLIRSQVALTEAQSAQARSLAEYNKALAQFQYRRGDLMQQRASHELEGRSSR